VLKTNPNTDRTYGCNELVINRILGGSAKNPGGGFRIISDGKLMFRLLEVTLMFVPECTGPDKVDNPPSKISPVDTIAPVIKLGYESLASISDTPRYGDPTGLRFTPIVASLSDVIVVRLSIGAFAIRVGKFRPIGSQETAFPIWTLLDAGTTMVALIRQFRIRIRSPGVLME